MPAEDGWQIEAALALAEADLAAAHGDVPVGAVVVDEDGAVLGRGHNRREVDGDPVAHAEIVALRAAARGRGSWRLERATLVVTLEPCAMCAGALVNARVTRVVFGARDPKAGALRSLYSLGDYLRHTPRLYMVAGVGADAAAGRLRAFFAALRAAGEK